MMQREREMEGDEFADKDAFVTQAYKDQMAEVRRAEEEERKRDGIRFTTKPIVFKANSCIRIAQGEEWPIIWDVTFLPQVVGRV